MKFRDMAVGDGRFKLEKDGMYDENGERVLPFSEDFVYRVLILATKMVDDGKLPDQAEYAYERSLFTRQTFQQLLWTLYVSGHSEAPSPYWIDKLRLKNDFHNWIVYLDGKFGETPIVTLAKCPSP